MKNLKAGVLGCANIAERMVIPAIKASKNFELVAVASRDKNKADSFAKKFNCEPVYGYNTLIERDDLDFIYIPLPTGLHKHWVLKALYNGKHVLIEKSLAPNYLEAKEIVDQAQNNDLLIQENFMFQYHRQISIIKNLLSQKKIGDLRCIRSSFGFPPFQDAQNIRYQKSLAGGALLDAGAYTIKIAQLLLDTYLSVKAATLNFDRQKNVDIFGGIYMQDNNGLIIETAFGFDQYYQCNVEIWGSKGKIIAERIFTAGPDVNPLIKIESANGIEIIDVGVDNHFINLLNDFSDTVLYRKDAFTQKYTSVLNQARLIQEAFDISTKNYYI